MTALTVIILTKNEARHIARAIASLDPLTCDVLVVDSGSTDDTVAQATRAGARVLHHEWTNYATQFNWALDQIKGQSGWVLRLDADEVVTPQLVAEIQAGLPDVAGITVGRSMCFMGQPVRHGGVFPIRVLRLFRNGLGRCETRWMDEHIIVGGPLAAFEGQIIDDNRNSLDWWTSKHNSYASREVIDILNQELGFLPQDRLAAKDTGRQAAIKRWIKEHIYARLPLGARAGAYFLYRYVLRGGFLDGRHARAFHVLQGFWYRYLVDAKLAEVRRHMTQTGDSPVAAIAAVLGVNVATPPIPKQEKAA
jgi:glycosyltransferase involved in cell wall biosynthesis